MDSSEHEIRQLAARMIRNDTDFFECIGFSIGHIGVFSHFAVENNDAYRASYRAFIEGTAGLIEFLCEHFGLHHTREECMIATSIFSFAIHYPETQFEPLADAIEKLL